MGDIMPAMLLCRAAGKSWKICSWLNRGRLTCTLPWSEHELKARGLTVQAWPVPCRTQTQIRCLAPRPLPGLRSLHGVPALLLWRGSAS